MKKAIAPQFLVSFLIGALLIVSVVFILKGCVDVTNVATSDYESLVREMNSLQQGQRKSVRLTMDDGTALFGISKNADKVQMTSTTLWGLVDSWKLTFERPVQCTKGSACVCLCKRDLGLKEFAAIRSYTIRCDPNALTCKPLSRDIYSSNSEMLKNSDLGLDESDFGPYSFKGGFFFEKESGSSSLVDFIQTVGGTVDKNIFKGLSQQHVKSVTIENYKDRMVVCFKSPCFSQEMKAEVDRNP
ncbi:hypothetical protein KY330_00785 [Candidatus Woesearchaeota archaeon]|nr:hypothetical protein [Candidatus Woesearchaeota archaeon]